MRNEMKSVLKQSALGMLNFFAYLGIGFALNALLIGRIPIFSDLLIAVLMIAVYVAGCLWIERRQPTELMGLSSVGNFAGGAGLGLGLFSFVMGLLWGIGIFHPTGWGSAAEIGPGAYFSILSAITIQILICGLLFRVAANTVGTWVAVLLVAVFFGFGSGFNPGATLWSSIAAAPAGLLLAASYAATKNLWFPIGIHAGWNFAEGSIFQMPLSGGGPDTALIKGYLSGPAILTGRAYGPEASIIAVLACLLVAAFLLLQTARIGGVERPAWHLRS